MWDENWANEVVVQPPNWGGGSAAAVQLSGGCVRCWKWEREREKGGFQYYCGVPTWPSKGSITHASLYCSVLLYLMALQGFIYEWVQQWGLRSLSLRSIKTNHTYWELMKQGFFHFTSALRKYVQLLTLLCSPPSSALQLRSLACSLLSSAPSFKEPWIAFQCYPGNICFFPSTLYFNCISFCIFKSIKATRQINSVLNGDTNEFFYSPPQLFFYFSCGSILTNCIMTKFSLHLDCICMCFITPCILWCTEV